MTPAPAPASGLALLAPLISALEEQGAKMVLLKPHPKIRSCSSCLLGATEDTVLASGALGAWEQGGRGRGRGRDHKMGSE